MSDIKTSHTYLNWIVLILLKGRFIIFLTINPDHAWHAWNPSEQQSKSPVYIVVTVNASQSNVWWSKFNPNIGKRNVFLNLFFSLDGSARRSSELLLQTKYLGGTADWWQGLYISPGWGCWCTLATHWRSYQSGLNVSIGPWGEPKLTAARLLESE